MLYRIDKHTCDAALKAKAEINKDGLLMAALNEDDLKRVSSLMPSCKVIHFEYEHGLHAEKKREFIECLNCL